ncbi:type I polyketide synthase [Cryptosporangium japonicum]|uniref:Type I polyketide synthase n=1 Tax=Cryptosporangium japonicum TaxID=80872 RepID=A0ABN0TK69_9ACTN
MNVPSEQLVEALRSALKEGERLRRDNAALSGAAAEPIAIVAMGCRYPGGVASPADLWRVVAEERDVIGAFPGDRGWDLGTLYDPDGERPGAVSVDRGPFLDDATRFDAGLFGIAPREAVAMEPQQRLLLEVAWEVLERAGLDPTGLSGSRTAAYVGAIPQDYAPAALAPADAEGHLLTGTTTSVASGRLAYTFGLAGPALTIDTACSSSLVALHLAVQALRRQECDLALAGGVTVLSTPGILVEFTRQRGLAPDGRCKPFSAAADGTALGEGAGLLLLERLSDAQRAGHPVLAVIRGSALNQDGASNGLTAPNPVAQEQLIRAALAASGLTAADVDAVEAHGTGTPLGDPMEAQALLATYGRRPAGTAPLWLGSVKSNIGHAQAAAGVAGVIKMVEALRHSVLPSTLHADRPSPHVDWEAGAVRLLTAAREWPAGDRPRRAGVSSFGISGTNAHLILEEAPPAVPVDRPAPVRPVDLGVVPWVLSGADDAALRRQAGRLAEFAAVSEDDDHGIGVTLATTRAALTHRAVVLGPTGPALRDGLASLREGRAAPDVVRGVVHRAGRVAVLFSGQGSQRAGAGRELYESCPVFADAVDAACVYLDEDLDRPLAPVLFADPGTESAAALDHTDFTQAGLFTVELGVFRLLEAAGLVPDYLLGHSIGELAAAHVAGVLSLPDACRLVSARGRLMRALPAVGAMLAVRADEREVEKWLDREGSGLSVAAVNGPRSVVVSGDRAAIEDFDQRRRAEGRRTRRLRVRHAFHSAHMAGMLADFRTVARTLTFHPPRTPIVSNATGAPIPDTELCDPEYWVRHVERTVRFADGIRWLEQRGVSTFLEVGPDGVLTALAEECLTASDRSAPVAVPTLRTGRPEGHTVAAALAHAHVRGATVRWERLLDGSARPDLPTYAFGGDRLWLRTRAITDPSAFGLVGVPHSLLGAGTPVPETGGWLFTARLSVRDQPWLADHTIGGRTVLPATAFLEIVLRAGADVGAGHVDELTIEAPLILPDDGTRRLQVLIGALDERGARRVTVHAEADSDGSAEPTWTRHADGTLRSSEHGAPPPSLGEWPPGEVVPVDLDGRYPRLADAGFGYGPAFRGLHRVSRAGDDVFVDVRLPDAAEPGRFGVHPALLDAVLQATGLTPDSDQLVEQPRLPFSWSDVAVHRPAGTALRARITAVGDARWSVEVATPEGEPVLSVGALTWRPAPSLRSGRHGALFRVGWSPLRIAAGPRPGTNRLEVVDRDRTGLAEALRRTGRPVAVRSDLTATESEHLFVACPPTAAEALTMVQDWLAADRPSEPRLVFVSRGAVAVEPGEVPDVDAAAVWGLVRSAQTEHPGRFTLADVGTFEPADVSTLLAGVDTGEPQFAVRDGVASAPHLSADGDPRSGAEQHPRLGPNDVALITGGTGGLGRVIARHLADAWGARHLLLVSRRGPNADGADDLVAELAGAGAHAEAVAADVGDHDALAAVLAAIPPERSLAVVIHAAGVLDDGTVSGLTPDRLAVVSRAKVDGARHLDALTRARELQAFVVFSSVVGVVGTAGQANYAAANAALDAIAARRVALGHRATALAWGPWDQRGEAGGGMAADLDDVAVRRFATAGLAPISIADGLALFDAGCASREPNLVPIRVERSSSESDGPRTVPALLRPLVRPRSGAAGRTGTRPAWLAGDLSAPESEHAAVRFVLDHVAGVLSYTPGVADAAADRSFKDLGLDSLTSLELRNAVGAATGIRLPAGVVFDHPTPRELARLLLAAGASPAAPAPAVASPAPADDPIVIVGMACRYPGDVRSPDDLWRLVTDGTDAIAGFPDDRGWNLEALYDPDPDRPGTSYTRSGGFLRDAADFDPEFFGISAREALAMDPQQRLVLETSWEALERAGIDPAVLRGSATGVFAGLMYHDYGGRPHEAPETLGGYLLTGSAGSVLSGRTAYTFGLEGPAVTVDTACSSSLVALHLAGQALRAGECSLALAGGVTVMATPATFVEFSRQRGLSADGRCKSFSAAADGTGWSEGAGMLVLERLSDARRNDHPILAVIRGSAVNQDGASNGLTAPSGPAQQKVIRQALSTGGLRPADVDAVEAHGTGTRLGDPIEAEALIATYGEHRPADRPLRLGSLKSNLGHTQAAAGVGGVIKMVLAMRHELLPRTLHADPPTPHVNWTDQVRLLTEPVAWPARPDRPRRAAVSSFGISGTNAHVILEEPPAARPGDPPTVPPVLAWPLSARTPAALRDQAERLWSYLDREPGVAPAAVARTLAGRPALEHRAVVSGPDRPTLLDALAVLARGADADGVVTGPAVSGAPPRVVFVFPGQGAQWEGMGRRLLDESPVFATRIAECERALAPHLDWSLTAVLRGAVDAPPLTRVDVVQPTLFAVMVGLADVWREYGVRPAAVIGHSQGEIAAACVAGALALPDAARVVAVRSRALRQLSGTGGMHSVALSVEQAATRIRPWGTALAIASVNGPRSVVVAGEQRALDALADGLSTDGIWNRRIAVDYPSHSPQIERIEAQLREELGEIRATEPAVPFHSTVYDRPVGAADLDSGYWYENVRRPVEFARGIRALAVGGADIFLEISAHPVVAAGIRETLDEVAPAAVTLGTLRRGRDDTGQIVAAVADAAVHGAPVDWAGRYRGQDRVDLPTYPFQRARYWLPATRTGAVGGHPLLPTAVSRADEDGWVLLGAVSTRTHPWLADHGVLGTTLMPGSAWAEMAGHAAATAGSATVEELVLETPLTVPDGAPVDLQATVGPARDGRRPIHLYGRLPGGQWTRHATGVLSDGAGAVPGPVTAWPPPGAEPRPVDGHYPRLRGLGVDYGPAFQGVRAVWQLGDDTYAEVVAPDVVAHDAGWTGPHPALLDAVLQVRELVPGADPDQARMPYSWEGLTVSAADDGTLRVRISPAGPDRFRVTATTADGRPVLSVAAFASRPVSADDLRRAADPGTGRLYRPEWTPLPGRTAPAVVPAGIRGAGDLARLDASAVTGPVVLHLEPATIGPDDPGLADAVRVATQHVLATLQAWLHDERFAASRLVVRTTGAVGDRITDLVHATVWGLVRSAQIENPGRFLLLDADPADSGAIADAVAAAEDEVLARGGRVLGCRLVPITAPVSVPRWSPPGTVLVTGAGGGLAPAVARHLADNGVERLVLVGRRGPDAPGASELRAELRERGTDVEIVACDVTDRAAVDALVASMPASHPLSAVVHAAAGLDDGVLETLRPEQVAGALAAKVGGALTLHAATRNCGLSAFVLFSSVAGLLGGAGQSGYAAANTFLDALATRRRQDGLAGQSLAWGLWDEQAGMAGRLGDVDLRRDERLGIAPLSSQDAVDLLDRAVADGAAVTVPVRFDELTLRTRASAGDLTPLLRGLVPTATETVPAPAEPALRERLSALPGDRRIPLVEELLIDLLRAVLGGTGTIPSGRAFRELGLDSLTALELRNRLGRVTGLRLPITVAFDHPTPAALARYVVDELLGDGDGGDGENAAAEAPDDEVRRALTGIPVDELRRAGLLDPLLRLAGRPAGGTDGRDDHPTASEHLRADLDAMDLDQLIEVALDGGET